MTLAPYLDHLPAQWSGGFEVSVSVDIDYQDYTPYLVIGYMTDNLGNAVLIQVEEGVATIPAECYQYSGNIMISLVLVKDDEQLVTAPAVINIAHAPMAGAGEASGEAGLIAAINAVVEAKMQSIGGLSEELKQALLDCFAHVAWIDDQGQTYYDALQAALYPPATLVSISAVYSGGDVYNTATLDDLKDDLVVTALYDDESTEVVNNYVLSGTIAIGAQTIGVAYGGKATTFEINVIEWLTSISAVYTQSGIVYNDDTLDDLKADLVVTANYADSSTETIPDTDYTLSGTLEIGTSTITVSYSGKTTTFTVTVTDHSRWVNNVLTLTPADGFANGNLATAYPYIGTYLATQRVSYAGLDVDVSDDYKYTVTYTTTHAGTTKIGVNTVLDTAVSKIENHQNLDNGDRLDSGWQNSGYILTPGSSARYFWFTFSGSNPSTITPEEFPTITITREAL